MSFTNDFDSASAETINRAEPAFGEHVVQLKQARSGIDQNGDRGWFIDCIEVEGPNEPGTEFSYMWYPDRQAKFKAKKEGELKRQLGAFFGYDATRSTTEIKVAVINTTFVDIGSKDNRINQGVYSPLSGRLARMKATPYFSKKSQREVPILEFRPYLENGQTVDRPVHGRLAAPAAIVTPPPAPVVAAPAAFPPAGWAKNPNDPSGTWYYEIANQNNQKTEAQLRAG